MLVLLFRGMPVRLEPSPSLRVAGLVPASRLFLLDALKIRVAGTSPATTLLSLIAIDIRFSRSIDQ